MRLKLPQPILNRRSLCAPRGCTAPTTNKSGIRPRVTVWCALVSEGSSTRGAWQSTSVIIGMGTLAALVIGLVAGLVMNDIPRGLGTWGTPVIIAFSVYGVFAAYRAGMRQR